MNQNSLFVIIKVPNGYGWMTREEYESLPDPVKEEHVDLIAVCPNAEKARFIFGLLPQIWTEGVHIAW